MKYILIMQLIIRFDKKTSNMTFWDILVLLTSMYVCSRISIVKVFERAFKKLYVEIIILKLNLL